MDEQTKSLLLQIAGYLRLVQRGFPASVSEARELEEKIGDAIARAENGVYTSDGANS